MKPNTTTSAGDDFPALMTVDDLIALAPATSRWVWQRLRDSGDGPRFITIGRRVFYPREDVKSWLDANLSTCR
ncbi:helix-turn-helix domain-containing protein [Corynebacterium aurimucosum]|nr:helix-turn-helix domain-containing protein [Corynebacterium aurimucosum]NJJ82022.1 helix-turn-helix domain-containing protein [Corynebacterium aurimucosum]